MQHLDCLPPSLDSRALGHKMTSSSKPKQTRTKNVPNGGSGLTPKEPCYLSRIRDRLLGKQAPRGCSIPGSTAPTGLFVQEPVPNSGQVDFHTPKFPVDSNSRSPVTSQGNTAIHYHVSTLNLVGSTLIQEVGSGARRQNQAGDVRGGAGNQGDVPVAGSGARGGGSPVDAAPKKPGGGSSVDAAPKKPPKPGGGSPVDAAPKKPGAPKKPVDAAPKKPGGGSPGDAAPKKPGGGSPVDAAPKKPVDAAPKKPGPPKKPMPPKKPGASRPP